MADTLLSVVTNIDRQLYFISERDLEPIFGMYAFTLAVIVTEKKHLHWLSLPYFHFLRIKHSSYEITMKLYNDQRNAQAFNLFIYFCLTCFGGRVAQSV
jgi:hypothetical protein